jgi:1-aminocyclopropane-1-carboxylate deaminase/D-cysteine desulfhydrase-like pyridoxal-dependent ACC family enzyme
MLEAYPGLKNIPWMPLMDGVPTPVQSLENVSKDFPGYQVWIKRDDICSSIYGGNKPRKFEFLFADAIKKKKNTMATAGGTGTNHGLASVLFSNALGLKAKVYMFKQPLTWGVQRKLLMYTNLNAEIKLVANYGDLAIRGLGLLLFHPKSYLMLPGGSPLFGIGTVAGCLGFVNAGFELAEQVKAGEISEPEYIFIAAGSTGSVSGLILGCKLAGLKTKVAAVQVSDNIITNPASIQRNIKNTLKLMRKADPSIPATSITYPEDFLFFGDYLGSEYGCMTKEGIAAVDFVARLEGDKGFHLETTYTGKACAAMIDFMKKTPSAKDQVVLLWNTYNSRDLTELSRKSKYAFEKLPKNFRQFFDEQQTCFQLKQCPANIAEACPAYYNDDNRCWLVKEALGDDTTACNNCPTRNEIEKKNAAKTA